MLSSITAEKGKGGLEAKLPGQDHISGLIFFSNNKPSGFGSDKIKNIVDVPSAEALGIVNDKSDETKASGGEVEITTVGNVGSIEKIIMDSQEIGIYIIQTGDSTADVASALVNDINNGNSGYVAVLNSSTIELTPPDGLGATINGNSHLVYSSSDGGVANVTQFSGGVDAFFDVIHYHISEFYRLNPKGELYVMIADVPSIYNFNEVQELQNFAEGKIRQIGIFHHLQPFATAFVTAMEVIAKTLETEHKPLSLLYGADIKGVSDLTTLADLKTLDSEKVSVIIGQDGNNIGAELFALRPYSITCLGATLGAVSLAKVHENIGWPGKFKPSEVELDVAALANGQIITATSLNLLEQLDSKGYIFLRKLEGLTGSYFNYSYTCTASTSDYNTIERNRTIDKAIRGTRTYLLPYLNSPVEVDPNTGKLSIDTIKFFESEAEKAIIQMKKDGELSGFDVYINPEQNILSTNELIITITLIIKGVAKQIVLKVGYALKIA